MDRLFRTVFLLASAALPALAAAQGSRAGFGSGRARDQRSGGDTTAAGARKPAPSFVDLVFQHRGDLKLTASQTVGVSDIRMASMSRRAVLNREVDSLKAAMGGPPEGTPTPPTDSSRKAMMAQRRAMGSVLGDLHDVDFDARKKTLALLTPEQQKEAEYYESVADAPTVPRQRGLLGGGGGSGRRGGGRPGGGEMDTPR